jgi:hypothetical protein
MLGKTSLILIISTVFFAAATASAQTNLNQFNIESVFSLPDELTIDVIPPHPRPNGQVSVNLRMYTEDLNSALISWSINGSRRAEGRGMTSFSFTTGKAGSESRLTVNITLQSGKSFSKSITVRPSEIDLIWQSNSYVPPFYKGKALMSRQGAVTIEAMPQVYSGGSRISADRLVYKWTVNGAVQESQSGYGRKVLQTSGPLLGTDLDISVVATDPISNASAQAYLTVKPADPLLLFYENSPLYGIVYERAVNGALDLSGEEVSVIASPFFINTQDNPIYRWTMNGRSAPEVSGLSATFRKPEGVTGSTFLSLKAENPIKILQFTENGFRINYKDESR